jgi:co-chaperonin GroES (HSP10)
MSIPKSQALLDKEAQSTATDQAQALDPTTNDVPMLHLPATPIECCNDFVAIMQASNKSALVMTESYSNEGVVVGVGPGVSDGAGGRLPLCVEFGDYVMFGERNIVTIIPVGPDQRMVIVSERNIICKVPNIEMTNAKL